MDAPKFDLAQAYALKRLQSAKTSDTAAAPATEARENEQAAGPVGHEQAAQAMIDAVSAGDVNALAECIKNLMGR